MRLTNFRILTQKEAERLWMHKNGGKTRTSKRWYSVWYNHNTHHRHLYSPSIIGLIRHIIDAYRNKYNWRRY